MGCRARGLDRALFNGRVVAAALLRRYRKDESVGIAMRGAAEIGWIVCWPEHVDAGRLLIETLVARLDEWSFDTRQLLGGGLPGPFSYGVHDAWPHLAVLAEHGGFRHTGDIELQLVAEVSVLALPGAAPLDGVRYERRLHAFGPAFIALLGDREIAMLEVDVDLTRNGTMASFAGWADVANLWVRESNRRTGIATWLLGQVAEWLRMSGARQLVAYALEGEESAPVECGAYLLGVDDAARPARRILAPPKTAVDATTTVEI